MGIEAKWKSRGIRVGKLPCGPLDKISDVPGVTVGHCTLADGEVQTGVTALLPHQGDIFHDKVMAASHVINGFGKTTGLVQIDELGTLETPILFTNTLSVGTVETALVKYMLDKNPDICETTGSVNPVVCECNDSGLNDIRGLHVTEENVRAALADCRADFAEGAVGAGRGMRWARARSATASRAASARPPVWWSWTGNSTPSVRWCSPTTPSSMTS